MVAKMRKPFLALIMALYMFSFFTSPAIAGMVSSVTSSGTEMNSEERAAEIEKIRQALENRIVREKLVAHGLSSEEVESKLGEMSDRQIHMLAQASDDVLAGGDALGAIIGILLIIVLVIVILKLLDKDIIIK